MRPNGADLDLASSFEGLALDPALVDGRTLPALSGQSDLTIQDGVELGGFAARTSCAASSGTIRTLRSRPAPTPALR